MPRKFSILIEDNPADRQQQGPCRQLEYGCRVTQKMGGTLFTIKRARNIVTGERYPYPCRIAISASGMAAVYYSNENQFKNLPAPDQIVEAIYLYNWSFTHQAVFTYQTMAENGQLYKKKATI